MFVNLVALIGPIIPFYPIRFPIILLISMASEIDIDRSSHKWELEPPPSPKALTDPKYNTTYKIHFNQLIIKSDDFESVFNFHWFHRQGLSVHSKPTSRLVCTCHMTILIIHSIKLLFYNILNQRNNLLLCSCNFLERTLNILRYKITIRRLCETTVVDYIYSSNVYSKLKRCWNATWKLFGLPLSTSINRYIYTSETRSEKFKTNIKELSVRVWELLELVELFKPATSRMTEVVLPKSYKLVDSFLKLSGGEIVTNFNSIVSQNIYYFTFTNTLTSTEGVIYFAPKTFNISQNC